MMMATRPQSPTAAASVQVVVRLRPLNEREKKHGTLPVVSASTNERTVTVIKGQGARQIRSNYKFDNVFTAFSSQEEVFDATLKPVIRDVLHGFESTVFAYGQTGTGKTHTMEGDLSKPEMHGVIPRSAVAIFKELESPEYTSSLVSCSFLEIYNEDLCDLLADPVGPTKRQKLDIMEGKNGPFCRGLSETKVSSADHVFSLMRNAQQQRQVGETNMNKQSSRSHCIFTMKIEAKKSLPGGSVLEVAGKLHCVDLAGSECAKSADLEKGNESQGARERERLNINRSLLTLGRVVSMLKEKQNGNKKRARIPYRDSKLTRILQESLGGRCKTCLIATISPSVTAIEESFSTLNYAQAANGIVNKPITTSLMTSQGASFNGSDIQSQSSTGDNAACSVEHWQEMECRLQYMQNQVEEAQNALARKHLQQQELVEKAEQAEASRKEATLKYEEATKEIVYLEEKVQEQGQKNKELDQQLSKTEATLEKSVAVLEATQHTEECLTNEARALLAALEQSVQESDKIYKSLKKSREDSVKQRDATKVFKTSLLSVFGNILQSLQKLKEVQKENRDYLSTTIIANGTMDRDFLNKIQSTVESTTENISNIATALESQLLDDGGIVSEFNTIGDSARTSLHKMNDRVSTNESTLRSSFVSIREDMANASLNMKKMHQNYMDSSSDVLELFEQGIAESKTQLTSLLSNATEALRKQSQEAAQRQQKLLDISTNWKSLISTSSQRVQNLAAMERNNVENMFQLLIKQLEKQEEIRNHLQQRGDYISENRISHLGCVQAQADLLKSTEDEILETRDRNNQFFQQFAKNVLDGVQDLLQTQMEKMKQCNEERCGVLISKNQSVVDNNIAIRQSAADMLDAADSSNKLLQSHTKYVHENDSKAASVLEIAKRTLDGIHDVSDEITSASNIAQKSMRKESEEAEHIATTQCNDMQESLLEDSNQLHHHLTIQVSDLTKEGINQLSDSNKRVSVFVEKDLVENIESKIKEKIEVPFVDFSEQLRQDTNAIGVSLDLGLQNATKKALEQKNTLASLQTSMASSTEEVRHQIQTQMEASKSREGAFVDAVATHEQDIMEKLSSSSKEATAGSKSFVEFTQSVVKVDEPVPEIQVRNVPSFSKSLTATPPENEILQNMSSNGQESGKENSPTKDNYSRPKKRRSGEAPLSDPGSNRNGNAGIVGTEKSKRHGDIKQSSKVIRKNKGSKKLKLSIPKPEAM